MLNYKFVIPTESAMTAWADTYIPRFEVYNEWISEGELVCNVGCNKQLGEANEFNPGGSDWGTGTGEDGRRGVDGNNVIGTVPPIPNGWDE